MLVGYNITYSGESKQSISLLFSIPEQYLQLAGQVRILSGVPFQLSDLTYYGGMQTVIAGRGGGMVHVRYKFPESELEPA